MGLLKQERNIYSFMSAASGTSYHKPPRIVSYRILSYRICFTPGSYHIILHLMIFIHLQFEQNNAPDLLLRSESLNVSYRIFSTFPLVFCPVACETQLRHPFPSSFSFSPLCFCLSTLCVLLTFAV